MNVELHIEQLVVDGLGLSPGHGPLVQRALEAELHRLLATGHLPLVGANGIALPMVRSQAIHGAGGADPIRLGTQIAGALVSGLGEWR